MEILLRALFTALPPPPPPPPRLEGAFDKRRSGAFEVLRGALDALRLRRDCERSSVELTL